MVQEAEIMKEVVQEAAIETEVVQEAEIVMENNTGLTNLVTLRHRE